MLDIDLDKPLTLQERAVVGKGLNNLRKDGLVPAVVHNHGRESLHVMGPEMELKKIYAAAGKHHPLNLAVGDQTYLALIKDVHLNPVKRQIEHIVFQAIRRDEKVEAEVPLRLEGEIPAEKVGLMILHHLDHVAVEALPADLPDEIIVDATKLAELHDKITVADLPVPKGVTILSEADHPIAVVVETPAIESLEAEVAEGEGEEGAGEAELDEDGNPIEPAAEGEDKKGRAQGGKEAEASGQKPSKE